MARYIKKYTRVGSMGPTEERGFAVWAGYDIEATDEDLSELGLLRVDDWTDEQLAERGVKRFKRVEQSDEELRAALGLRRN
jgi:hypothetical protein